MGILNVTPDSFSDGGQLTVEKHLLERAQEMVEAGVAIIDVGGESTRPFATPVSAEEELRRVIPAIRALRRQFDLPISIDTTKSVVAAQALSAGADIINDISALRFDPQMADVANKFGAPVIIMHMQGTPADMQLGPKYEDVIDESLRFLGERLQWLMAQGIEQSRIIVDPGVGFGKTLAHNLLILKRAEEYNTLGCPVLIGHSRKSFIGKILGRNVCNRDIPTAVISSILATKKIAILRVHDVKATREALLINQAIAQAC